MSSRFLAIDFETANYSRNSACAVALAVVENCTIIETASFLIKPPTDYFTFSSLHGIRWSDVREQKTFEELWPQISHYFSDIDFVAAHNASFDRSVLESCCRHYEIKPPAADYRCSYRLAKKLLNLDKYSLDKVSAYYGIELNHHEALSDTVACAKIMIELEKLAAC